MRLWPLLLLLLAGCAEPGLVEPTTVLPADAPGGLPWLVHLWGCGFCDETGVWGSVLAIHADGTLQWFPFGPADGMYAPQGTDPYAAQHEAAFSALRDVGGGYHARPGMVAYHDAFGRLGDAEWAQARAVLAANDDGSRAPGIDRYPCEDCSAPVVAIVDEPVRGGKVLSMRGGNVDADSDWGRLEGELALLHGRMQDAAGWTPPQDLDAPELRVALYDEAGAQTLNVLAGETLRVSAEGTRDPNLASVRLYVDTPAGRQAHDLYGFGVFLDVPLALDEGLYEARMVAEDLAGNQAERAFWVAFDGHDAVSWTPEGAVLPLSEPPPCGEARGLPWEGTPTRIIDIPVQAIDRTEVSADVLAFLDGPATGRLCLDGEPVGETVGPGGPQAYDLPGPEAATLQFVVHATSKAPIEASYRVTYPTHYLH